MKVKELIELLKAVDPELPVWTRDHEGEQCEAESLDVLEAVKTHWWPHDNRPKRAMLWD